MAEDRNKPPPGYSTITAGNTPSWVGTCTDWKYSHADAVAACWEHRDRVVAGALHHFEAAPHAAFLLGQRVTADDREQQALGVEKALAAVREWVEAGQRWRLQDALVDLAAKVRRSDD